MRGSGSGWVDMGQGMSMQEGRSSTKGEFIGSSCLLMRSGGVALGNMTAGWPLRTGCLPGLLARVRIGSGEPGKM